MKKLIIIFTITIFTLGIPVNQTMAEQEQKGKKFVEIEITKSAVKDTRQRISMDEIFAPPAEFSVQILDKDKNKICSGYQVLSNLFISAGHCKEEAAYIKKGFYHLTETVEITAKDIHKKYKPQQNAKDIPLYDVAAFFTSEGIEFDEKKAPEIKVVDSPLNKAFLTFGYPQDQWGDLPWKFQGSIDELRKEEGLSIGFSKGYAFFGQSGSPVIINGAFSGIVTNISGISKEFKFKIGNVPIHYSIFQVNRVVIQLFNQDITNAINDWKKQAECSFNRDRTVKDCSDYSPGY